ncbi:MAG: DUF2332 domain-containing protein [Acidimicrobiales bacterium]
MQRRTRGAASDGTDGAAMAGHDPQVSTAENYRRFARAEAAGRSPAYERLAYQVADHVELIGFLDTLPVAKRQPNLFFAAARFLSGAPPDLESLRRLVSERHGELAAVILDRRTQTNEAARCAILLPALAALPGPLAILEVGAAAGLTLLVDYYSYDYGGHHVGGLDPQAPTFRCRTSGPVPLPTHVPDVVWRAGLDLNPLDVADPDDVDWLRCLLWPGEADRAERLQAAVETARRHRPVVHRGDLLDDLAALTEQAPADATLVVYHTAVLAYVDGDRRSAFAREVDRLGARWLSCEGAGVVPGAPAPSGPDGGFALVLDGVELLTTADPHGAWVNWFP